MLHSQLVRKLLILFFPLAALTHEEQVGQVFISFFYGEAADIDFLLESKLGNIIYFNWANGLQSPEQVQSLSQELYDALPIIPFIAIDQEGGRVSRLHWPGALLELGQLGINLNLAPALERAPDPEGMIDLLHKQGVLATLKHFPGLGNVAQDTHDELGISSGAELDAFFALKDRADAIMTAHALYPELDPDNPATHSKAILTDLLRNEWGYEGLIISDSLTMKGIAPHQSTFEEAVESVTEAALRAFAAGCDLLIIGDLNWATPEQNYFLIQEVMAQFGRQVDQDRLSEAVERILRVKSGMAAAFARLRGQHVGCPQSARA